MRQVLFLLLEETSFRLKENQLPTNHLQISVSVQKYKYENKNYCAQMELTFQEKLFILELAFPNLKKFIFHSNSPRKLERSLHVNWNVLFVF